MNNIYDNLDSIDRDPYIYTKKDGFFDGYFDAAAEVLTHFDGLCQMTGVNASGISELYASARQDAYKIKFLEDDSSRMSFSALIDPEPSSFDLESFLFPCAEEDMESVFGILKPWDRYFIDLNYDVPNAFSLNRAVMEGYDVQYAYSVRFGDMFLDDVAFVNTFVTNAAYDLVVFAPSLPQALTYHTSKVFRSTHDTQKPSQAVRPGQILLEYQSGSVPGSSVVTRTIRFPRYTQSGHAVTMTEPGEILDDVIDWLSKTGLSMVTQKYPIKDNQ
jgi:hypothetical protein